MNWLRRRRKNTLKQPPPERRELLRPLKWMLAGIALLLYSIRSVDIGTRNMTAAARSTVIANAAMTSKMAFFIRRLSVVIVLVPDYM